MTIGVYDSEDNPVYATKNYHPPRSPREKLYQEIVKAEKEYKNTTPEQKASKKMLLDQIYQIWNECYSMNLYS